MKKVGFFVIENQAVIENLFSGHCCFVLIYLWIGSASIQSNIENYLYTAVAVTQTAKYIFWKLFFIFESLNDNSNDTKLQFLFYPFRIRSPGIIFTIDTNISIREIKLKIAQTIRNEYFYCKLKLPCMTPSHITYRIEIMRSSQFKFIISIEIDMFYIMTNGTDRATILNNVQIYQKRGTNSRLQLTNKHTNESKCRSLTAISCLYPSADHSTSRAFSTWNNWSNKVRIFKVIHMHTCFFRIFYLQCFPDDVFNL